MEVLTDCASTIRPPGDQEKECAVQVLEYIGAQRRKLAKKLQAEGRQSGRRLHNALKRAPDELDKSIRQNAEAHVGKIVAPNAGRRQRCGKNVQVPRQPGWEAIATLAG